jgi:hypothetical protein
LPIGKLFNVAGALVILVGAVAGIVEHTAFETFIESTVAGGVVYWFGDLLA